MTAAEARVRVYFTPLSNPCGEGATCCGPVGMSVEAAEALRGAVAEAVPGAVVELVDASGKLHLHRDGAVLRMVNTLGLAVYPVITVDGEIVSMGPPVVDELGPLVRARLRQGQPLATGESRAL
jgi:hypothetical protein